MVSPWAKDAVFYHIYPLGLCGAPERNDFTLPVECRLEVLYPWLDHLKSLGADALYLGPVFQSSSHGYDTADYYQIDRRLGDNDDFARFAESVHHKGIRLVLDGVFNHVGRDFWAFKDVLKNGEGSAYKDWFFNLRFGERSPHGDTFSYEGWQGHTSLVKLNLAHPHVREHLFDAVAMWMDRFAIDGLRLDAADCIDKDFLQALHAFTKSRQPDFWLMGEVVHGDYRDWANPETLDSVTNYECYKGLYSSLVDVNYFEIAYALNRQFGHEGIYQNLWLYNFVDNHDVDRVASKFEGSSLLYPLYLLLFTMPGIPSAYYGSEWGESAVKDEWTDAALRPALDLEKCKREAPVEGLAGFIRQLANLRKALMPLRHGAYQELHVNHQQFAFTRKSGDERVIIILNSAKEPAELSLDLPGMGGIWIDQLGQGESFNVEEDRLRLSIPGNWGRILTRG
jgi:glycosidase